MKKTKNPIFNVMHVRKQTKDGMTVDQQLVNAYALSDSGVPNGCYILRDGQVECPRKRGEKVFVQYTSIFRERI